MYTLLTIGCMMGILCDYKIHKTIEEEYDFTPNSRNALLLFGAIVGNICLLSTIIHVCLKYLP